MDWSQQLGTSVRRIPTGPPKIHKIEGWDHMTHPQRMEVIYRIGIAQGHDPRVATQAVEILNQYGVKDRQYKKQAAALLDWVQNNIRYVNEPGERLQSPLYTLRPDVRYGDCDDMVILYIALCTSLRLHCQPVIVGTRAGKHVRYVYGDGNPPEGVSWTHIYARVHDNPYGQGRWHFAEPTLRVPLGWDIVKAKGRLPELGGLHGLAEVPAVGNYGETTIMDLTQEESIPGKKGKEVVLPHVDPEQPGGINWPFVFASITIGVTSSIITTYLLEAVQERKRRYTDHRPESYAITLPDVENL